MFDEVVFESVEGPDVVSELIEFVLVLDGIFAGDDGVFGAKSVFDGVLGATLLALVGTRAGAASGTA